MLDGLRPINKERTSSQGSMTIELAIIFPVIIYALITVFYLLLVLYQYAAIQALVDRTAMNSGLAWAKLNGVGDPEGLLHEGEISINEVKDSLYWRLGIFDNGDAKAELITQYLQEELENYQLLTPKEGVVNVKLNNYLLYQKITIQVKLRYQSPFPFINLMMGKKEADYQLIVRSEARVKDSSEMIRNIDLASDLLEEFEVTANLKHKYFDAINQTKQKVYDFFNK